MDSKIRTFNSVFIISFFSVLNFILSVLLQLFLASLFGAKMQMDAYIVAMVIPMIIANLIISFEVIFVPSFKHYSLTEDKQIFYNLINTIFNLLALMLIMISIFSILLAPKLVSIFAPGFSQQVKDLTTNLFRIMIPSAIFSGLAAFLTSLYHCEEKFILPAFAPVANIAVVIITTFLLNSTLGILSLAWATLFGSIVQFLILVLGLLREKQYCFVLDIKQKEIVTISRKILYLGTGGLSLGLILMFEKFLASKLPEGSISSLGYASRIISIIVLFPSFAIPTVLLPQLSNYYSLKDINKLGDLLSKGIRNTFLCVFPVAILMLIFRVPLIKLLFERGAFDSLAVSNTSLALFFYSGILIAMGTAKIITLGFFVIHDVLTPSLLMVGTFLFYACIAPILGDLFSFAGLALSFSIACMVSLIVQFAILRKRLSGIDGRKIFDFSLKMIISSLIMGILAHSIFKILPDFFVREKFSLALRLSISLFAAFIIFNILCFIFRIKELSLVYETIYARLKIFTQKTF